MNYEMEELLPIVAELADKYTSKESTSIPYETAQMLMGAVIYCIREYWRDEESKAGIIAADGGNLPDARLAYEKGYELVLKKTRLAKALYDEIIADFEDYGCRNYSDTIRLGMPQFFLRYDARFSPQDHLLTLDYPCMGGPIQESGVDLIFEYLKKIREEQRILETFEPEEVREILEEVCPEYEELFFDNICEAVLRRSGE